MLLTNWFPVNGCVFAALEYVVNQEVGVALTALLLVDWHI